MDTRDATLISDLADTIRRASPVEKDSQAAGLIDRLICSQSDAVYVLVQTVLVQQEALQRAERAPAAPFRGSKLVKSAAAGAAGLVGGGMLLARAISGLFGDARPGGDSAAYGDEGGWEDDA
jgi:hypothetical protein